MSLRAAAPRLSVAPMMDHTDRHFRFFMRTMTRETLLYTEMITASAIEHGDAEALLAYSPEEHPLALQLGGDDPAALARCAKIAEDLGYDEVNLNCGCPSPRVQRGSFGAALMTTPEVVADAIAALRAAVRVPVTVKHRIGVDDLDRYEDMARFVEIVAAAGCDRFTVHARKAWLSGLSPKENRTVPPLRYDDVYRLKREHPDLAVELNGGVRSLEAALGHLDRVDAVMIGRAAAEEPYLLSLADQMIFGVTGVLQPTRAEVVARMEPYLATAAAAGHRSGAVLRHLQPLFAGLPGARAWRRHLTTQAGRDGVSVVREGLALVRRAADSPRARYAEMA